MFHRICSLAANVMSLPLYWVGLIAPRRRDLWVFGAWFGHGYSDNSRWLFESVRENKPQIRAVWLTRERGIVADLRRQGAEAYLSNSLKGFWLSCRAGLVVACCGNLDVNRLAIARAKKLQLWHGSPMKKIGLADKFARKPTRILKLLQKIWQLVFPFTKEKWDVVIAAGDAFQEYMAGAFGMDLQQVKVTGYPRNDIFFRVPTPTVPLLDNIKNKTGAKHIILYAPTHRKEGVKEDMDKLFETFKSDDFERFLKEHNAVLLIKMHYYFRFFSEKVDFCEKKSRVYWLNGAAVPEINLLLNFTDILITDYSGVYFDYLLLDKPVVLAPFDLEHYLAGDREMYEDYNLVATAGPRCRDWPEVMEACRNILSGNDEYQENRRLAGRKYNAYLDGNSCARVIEVARAMVGEP